VFYDLVAKEQAVNHFRPQLRNIESVSRVEFGELRLPDNCWDCRWHSEDLDRVAVHCYEGREVMGVVSVELALHDIDR
jgi:hypothetical protein